VLRHATSAVVRMAWLLVGSLVTGAAPEVVGVAVGLVVGDGLGLGDGDGDGLVDDGEGDGDGGVVVGVLVGEHGAGTGSTPPTPLGVLPGVVGAALLWVDDGVPEPEFAWLPESLGLPPPPALLEAGEPDECPLSKENPNGPRSPPRAKTPATTSTTAPPTARAGRSQAIARPTEMRGEELAWRGRFAEARAAMPPTTGNDRSRPPWLATLALALPAVTAPVSDPAADPDRIWLNQDWHRTASTQPMVVNSLRSSHHCRLSHGSASRAWIFVKPSPTGSM
jgi:hypothetical protein